MNIKKELEEAQGHAAAGVYTRRKMSFAENVILTIKILAGFGLLGAALRVISVWKAVE